MDAIVHPFIYIVQDYCCTIGLSFMMDKKNPIVKLVHLKSKNRMKKKLSEGRNSILQSIALRLQSRNENSENKKKKKYEVKMGKYS